MQGNNNQANYAKLPTSAETTIEQGFENGVPHKRGYVSTSTKSNEIEEDNEASGKVSKNVGGIQS